MANTIEYILVDIYGKHEVGLPVIKEFDNVN